MGDTEKAKGTELVLNVRNIDGHYLQGDLIGQGSYARVYNCGLVPPGLAQGAEPLWEKAMKVIEVDDTQATSDRRRSLMEAAVLSHVVHDCVIKLDGLFALPASIVLVMDKIDISAKQLVQSTQLANAEIKSIAQQLLSALACLHLCGVVHRDVKPENIMLRRTPRGSYDVKLIDFGLSSILPLLDAGPDAAATPQASSSSSASVTSTTPAAAAARIPTHVSGTVNSMSPDMLRHLVDANGGRTKLIYASVRQLCYYDVYAAGVFLYGMLCRAPPFKGSNPAEILASSQKGELNFRLCTGYNRLDAPSKQVLQAMLLSDTVTACTRGELPSYPDASEIAEHAFFGDGVPTRDCEAQCAAERVHRRLHNLSCADTPSLQAILLEEMRGGACSDDDAALLPSPADDAADFEMFSAVGSCPDAEQQLCFEDAL